MKKYNQTMVILSMVLTLTGLLFFAMRMEQLSKIETPYGNPSESPAFILGLLSFCLGIPGIFWIITFLFPNKTTNGNVNKINQDYEDEEIAVLRKAFDVVVATQSDLRKKFETIKSSLSQGLINNSTYNLEKQQLELKFNTVTAEKERIKKRYDAIRNLSSELSNLNKLVRDGVITESEKDRKRNELINRKM